MRSLFSTLAGLCLAIAACSQNQPAFEKKPFRDPDGNLYWPLSVPVYLQLTTSQNSTDGVVLTQGVSASAREAAKPMTWDGHGIHYIRHVDSHNPKAGESTVIFPVNVDGIAPVSAVELTGATRYATANAARVYFGKGLTIGFKAKDEMSGLEGIYMSVNQVSFTAFATPMTLTEEKEYNVQYFAVDKVGNAESPKLAIFTLDLTPPASSHEVSGSHIDGQILAPGAFITLAGRDEASGVKKTEYYFDGQKPALYGGKIALTGLVDGEHILHYYSLDQVGNVEAPKQFTFYLDSKGPEVKSAFDANFVVSSGKSYATSGTLVSLEATDNKSGVKQLFYSINGGKEQVYTAPFSLPAKPGAHSVRYRAVDNLGNVGTTFTNTQIATIYVDDTPPVVTHTVSTPKVFARDTLFITDKALFTIKSYDAESGGAIVDYKIDNNEVVTYEQPFSVPAEGKHALSYSGTDLVNNSAEKTSVFVVDNSAPEIFTHTSLEKIGTQKLVSKEQEIPIYASGTMFYMAATDKSVGTKAIYYSLNHQPEVQYTQPVKLVTKGVHALKIKAVDFLGNVRTIDTLEFAVQ